jgi:hypothetical protein
MTIEGLVNYLGAKLPLRLNAQQHIRLLTTVFVLVFASTVIIHLLLQQMQSPGGVLIHATIIGLVYVIGVGLATTFLYLLRNATRGVRVWHLWAASMAGFIFSYYYMPIDSAPVWLFGVDASGHSEPMDFWQLLPAWFLVTYFLIQPYLSGSLKSELARLKEINEQLSGRDSHIGRAEGQLIRFASGRTEFTLGAASIRNVIVEDHYCYVHYRRNDSYQKRDLAMPLRDVRTLLPSYFVQVHRSHIINPAYVASIRRINRSIRVILDGGFEVPVSRHRLDTVLPLLRIRDR